MTDVYAYLGFKSHNDIGLFTSANGDAVGEFMKGLGWTKQRPRKNGRPERAFVKGNGPWYGVSWPHGPGSIATIVEEVGGGSGAGTGSTVIDAGHLF